MAVIAPSTVLKVFFLPHILWRLSIKTSHSYSFVLIPYFLGTKLLILDEFCEKIVNFAP